MRRASRVAGIFLNVERKISCRTPPTLTHTRPPAIVMPITDKKLFTLSIAMVLCPHHGEWFVRFSLSVETSAILVKSADVPGTARRLGMYEPVGVGRSTSPLGQNPPGCNFFLLPQNSIRRRFVLKTGTNPYSWPYDG